MLQTKKTTKFNHLKLLNIKIMKKIITICIALIITSNLWAQVPQKMNYQAVIRNSNNALVVSSSVGVRISILQSIVTGSAVYSETHSSTTNANGLVTLEIGSGSPQTGAFDGIDWANGPFFIKTETDPSGGTSYSIMATSELMSVPYALNAANGLASGTSNNQIMYWNGSSWTTLDPGTNGQVLTVCGGSLSWTTNGVCPPSYPAGSVYCTSGPTAVVDVVNPVTGKTWMDRNLGATQAATSATDADSYGDLYQWGRRSDGHQCRNSTTITTLSTTDQPAHGNFILTTVSLYPYDWVSPQNNNLWQGVNGINNPCPTGYRLPTETEMDEERMTWTQAPINSTNSSIGAFASPLKFPMAGWRFTDGSLATVGTYGRYWTSSVTGVFARYLRNDVSLAQNDTAHRSDGLSVRCIKD